MSGRMSGGGSFGGRGGGFGGSRGGSFGGGSRSGGYGGSGRMSGGRSFGSTGPGISRSGGSRNTGGGVPVGGGFGPRPVGGGGFLPGMMAGGLLGSTMGRRRGWGWGGGGAGMGRGCGCGGLIGALLILMLVFSLLRSCNPAMMSPATVPAGNAPVGTGAVMLDARAENDFNLNDHVGQDVVNVPFDDYFEENAAYMIPNRNTVVEVCSYQAATAAEIVTIMQNDLGYRTVTNAGVCGQ